MEMLLPIRMHDSHAALRTKLVAQPICRPMGSGGPLFGCKKGDSEVGI